VYVVGDPSTKYRFNNYTLGPNPGNCGKNLYYYYAQYQSNLTYVPYQIYSMFDTVGDDGDDAMLLLGQYYPDNSLITNLTLDIVATLFLVIGSFRSPNQNVNYRFVDPCQFSKLKISLIDDQNYTLYSNST